MVPLYQQHLINRIMSSIIGDVYFLTWMTQVPCLLLSISYLCHVIQTVEDVLSGFFGFDFCFTFMLLWSL